ncbi:GNAT family N-acetyltransferase [Cryobacterium tagatosivorans]|uniref:N-acetyltransferase n=1 Tax=Cryobacterium tagatosivorans TaxID=1259199 RepID=A0A4V3I6V3_9MICO|nr:GNAT family N-acetyltransferase [Cryobacterium tagatosivorans]TFB56302.1 N-acetyltransferase [Cryobacterium tagatosivorans]
MTGKDRFTLRAAVLEDADALGTLHIAVWRATYETCMDPNFLAGLDTADWIADWRKILCTDDGRRTIVAVDPERDGAIVGFASAGPSHDAQPIAETELYVLNTDVSCHGSGVAARLLEAVLLHQSASLWVVEQNDRAQAFYRKHRFVVEGALKWDPEAGAQDVRMRR